jgi:hypothetical protein
MIGGRARGSEDWGSVLKMRRAEMSLYLKLVFSGFGLRCWIEEINGEDLKNQQSALWMMVTVRLWYGSWSRADTLTEVD